MVVHDGEFTDPCGEASRKASASSFPSTACGVQITRLTETPAARSWKASTINELRSHPRVAVKPPSSLILSIWTCTTTILVAHCAPNASKLCLSFSSPYNEHWAEPAPFDGGAGPNRNRLVLVNDDAEAVTNAEDDGWRPGQQLRGVASDGRTLVVAEDISHRVHVMDAETMCVRHTSPVKYPGPIVLDDEQRSWVIPS